MRRPKAPRQDPATPQPLPAPHPLTTVIRHAQPREALGAWIRSAPRRPASRRRPQQIGTAARRRDMRASWRDEQSAPRDASPASASAIASACVSRRLRQPRPTTRPSRPRGNRHRDWARCARGTARPAPAAAIRRASRERVRSAWRRHQSARLRQRSSICERQRRCAPRPCLGVARCLAQAVDQLHGTRIGAVGAPLLK